MRFYRKNQIFPNFFAYFQKSSYFCKWNDMTKQKKGLTMGILDIIAVVALVIIGGFIYWNKKRG